MFRNKLKPFLLLLLFSVAFCLKADYYDGVINLTGDALFNGLRNLISNNTNTSYDASKVVLYQTLDNFDGYVTCVYTGQEYYVGFNYTGSSNPNTEHTYAQSWFNGTDTDKKKSDLHHLFITNSVVNSSRGNYPFDVVANHNTATVYYTYTPWQSYRGYNAQNRMVFEPADEFKGNIARALLYFYTRYSGESLIQQNVDMLPTLLIWHSFDPPDAAEITRNTGVFNYQNNRNPYIDHPEFVAIIWGGNDVEDVVLPAVPELVINAVYPNPFTSGLSIGITIQKSALLTTSVYNIKGQLVYSENSVVTAGENKVFWQGQDNKGQNTPAGVYLIKVQSGDKQAVTKVWKRIDD